MEKAQQQTAIALATAILINDTSSFVEITHPMDLSELRTMLNAVASLFSTVIDEQQRELIIGSLQALGVHVAGKDDGSA